MAVASSITFGMGARVFWAHCWRVLLLSLAAGIVLGLLFKLLPFSALMQALLKIGMSVLVSVYVLGIVFNRAYRDFIVQLVGPDDEVMREPGWGHRLTLWWSLYWRQMLVGVVLVIPVLLVSKPLAEMIQSQPLEQQCQRQLDLYQQFRNLPNADMQLRPVVAEFKRLNCQPVMERAQSAERKEMLGRWGIAVLLASLALLVANMKIFQIVLRKRYQTMRVLVTHRA